MTEFLNNLWLYTGDILPSLILGLLLGGVVHEFLPEELIDKYLTEKGLMPLLYVTAVGALLPVCCFGSLPVACTFRKKGVPLGPVLAFLIAAPATSVTAVLVTWKLMGWQFTLCMALGVIITGLVMGMIGDLFTMEEVPVTSEACPMCAECRDRNHHHHQPGFTHKVISIFYYAFVDTPREMGVELIIGVTLAAAVSTIVPVKEFIGHFLTGAPGYVFALVFGTVASICSTASVPLACAFVSSGMNVGAAMVLLIAGPVTSYGAMLVIKKEFGTKVLITYILVVSIMAVLIGYLSSLIISSCPCVKGAAHELQDVIYYAFAGALNA